MQLFLFWSSELTMPPLLLSANENGVHVDEVARRLGMTRAQILYTCICVMLSINVIFKSAGSLLCSWLTWPAFIPPSMTIISGLL